MADKEPAQNLAAREKTTLESSVVTTPRPTHPSGLIARFLSRVKPRSKRRGVGLRSLRIRFLLLAPAIFLLLVTTTYPLVTAFFNSFRSWSLRRPGEEQWIGLGNYLRAFGDNNFINSVLVTMNFTILSVTLTLVIGLAIAVFLQKEGRLSTFAKVLLIFPFAVSPALKGYSFRFMLNENYGILNAILTPVVQAFGFILTLGGLIQYPTVEISWQVGRHTILPALTLPVATNTIWLADEFWALFWIAMSETWGWAPLIALMFLGALGAISPEIFQAARIDGANNWQLFWKITLPLLKPVILIAALLKTIFSLKMFDQVVTMTGGGPGRATQTINHYIYQVAFGRSLEMGYASALAYILVIGLSIFAFLYVRVLLQEKNS